MTQRSEAPSEAAAVVSRDDLLERLAHMQQELDRLRQRFAQTASPACPPGPCDLLVCRAGEQRMAVPIACIVKVVPTALLTVLPEAMPALLGVLNLHGEPIPVVDILHRISGRAHESELSDLIIVAETGARKVGLLIQEVFEVAHVPAGAIEPTSPDFPGAPYITGLTLVKDVQVLLLDAGILADLLGVPTMQGQAPDVPPEASSEH